MQRAHDVSPYNHSCLLFMENLKTGTRGPLVTRTGHATPLNPLQVKLLMHVLWTDVSDQTQQKPPTLCAGLRGFRHISGCLETKRASQVSEGALCPSSYSCHTTSYVPMCMGKEEVVSMGQRAHRCLHARSGQSETSRRLLQSLTALPVWLILLFFYPTTELFSSFHLIQVFHTSTAIFLLKEFWGASRSDI